MIKDFFVIFMFDVQVRLLYTFFVIRILRNLRRNSNGIIRNMEKESL